MKRAIGVMAVLAIVTIAAAISEEDLVLMGDGCPVGTDRWSTVGLDYASEFEGFPTREEAVRGELQDASFEVSNGSIVRAVARSEPDAPVIVETSEGLPVVIRLENVNGGWRVSAADWCRRRSAD